jgi:NADH dehydrogenase FAD-containing subunit
VLLGEVVDIDLAAREVVLDTIGERSRVRYDSLIVAAGAAQSYFGHDEFAIHAPGMKTIDDAIELRGRIFGAFEMAELEASGRPVIAKPRTPVSRSMTNLSSPSTTVFSQRALVIAATRCLSRRRTGSR